MEIKIQLICPYCHNQFWHLLELTDRFESYHFALCDTEESPGCDRRFAFSIYLDPVISTFRLDNSQMGRVNENTKILRG